MLHTNIGVNAAGRLTFAGVDTAELAARFGTPLYLLDEDRVRARAREYVSTMRECMPEGSVPLYAGKALSFAGIYRVVCSEGMSIDGTPLPEDLVCRSADLEAGKETEFRVLIPADIVSGLGIGQCSALSVRFHAVTRGGEETDGGIVFRFPYHLGLLGSP